MKIVSANDAARRFATLLDQVEGGETIVVVRGGRRIATIRPLTTAAGRALKDLLRRHPPDPTWGEELQELRCLTRLDSRRP
jgi:antitoxin (DNA-binding transcriptional repressor) of toxin-antitoxin stability system